MKKLTEAEQDKLVDDLVSNWGIPFDKGQPQRAKAKIMAIARESQPTIKMEVKPKKLWMRVAAAVALLLALTLSALILGNTQIQNDSKLAFDHILPNGSNITLNPGAELGYNKFTWKLNRNVDFQGEGFFDIVPGPSFKIATEKGNVSVLGTTFTVWADQDDLMVHCVSGTVKVEGKSAFATLGPGEMIQYSAESIGGKTNFEHPGFYAPRSISDELEFEQVPLQLVLHELEIILEKEIIITFKADDLTYSGRINPSNMETCLDVLCKPFNAKHKIERDGSVVIYE